MTVPPQVLSDSPEIRRASALLTIDLNALAANWHTCAGLSAATVETAAVVKAGGYGVGAGQAAAALRNAGCETFFVATIDEGLALRKALGKGPKIHILDGFLSGTGDEFTHHHLIPVLNSLEQIDAWRADQQARDTALPSDLHIDTGMARLGLGADELQAVIDTPELLAGLNTQLILSHLVAAEDPSSPLNAHQLALFEHARAHLPAAPAALANSSALFLPRPYHLDLVRPGVALYGVNPTPGKPNPMAQVVRLQARILQVRTIDTPTTVGYGATYTAQGVERIATISAGYADGYHRSLSNSGVAYIGPHKAPVVGRVSMDLIALNVTDVPEDMCQPGHWVDLIGANNPLDDVARRAATIGYEILTSLGARLQRIYVGGTP